MAMHHSLTHVIGVVAISVTLASGIAVRFSFAHEDHKMECNEASINAMKADIQSMPNGKAKTTATKEMQAAQDMLRKKDNNACVTHMHAAMEAMEK